jgi:hypothetical protein
LLHRTGAVTHRAAAGQKRTSRLECPWVLRWQTAERKDSIKS